MNYADFLSRKDRSREPEGFKPLWIGDFLFDFQKALVEWAIIQGRCAIFADCGLGKTPMQLVWAENVVRKLNKPVLIAAPLSVSNQTVREGKKFGIEVHRSRDGSLKKGINITNYERLDKFDPEKLGGLVLDESSILKNFDGKTRKQITNFAKIIPYRLLCTATPSPNDYMELGTSSEALGVMGRNQMLGMFFTNGGETTQQWSLKGHAKIRFWRWVAAWARAIRKPSDLGFPDKAFVLPKLEVLHSTLKSPREIGCVLPKIAETLSEQREEKRATAEKRCQGAADWLKGRKNGVAWCQLNVESDLLEKYLKGSVQVKGSESEEAKEEKLEAFSLGKVPYLVTKPKIASFGLNWQHCNSVTYFPSWSHEQYYQAIRRCWRFGQRKEVACNLIYTESEAAVAQGMVRKEKQSIELYDSIVREMNYILRPKKAELSGKTLTLPGWIA